MASSWDAWLAKSPARPARARVLMAPAEVPQMMGKGVWIRAGSSSRNALSTPTW